MSKSIEITVKCNNCGNELEIENDSANAYGDLILYVPPCPECVDKLKD